jgi:hypothetical protein
MNNIKQEREHTMNQKPVGINVDLLKQVQEIAKDVNNTASNVASALLKFALENVDVASLDLPVPKKRGRKPTQKTVAPSFGYTQEAEMTNQL